MHPVRHSVVDVLPAYFLFDKAILGNFSLTTPKEKYLLKEYCSEYEGIYNTPSHHFARVFKGLKLPRKWQEGETEVFPYPHKAIPGKYPYCFYVDISQAYYQISKVFGLEGQYSEGKYYGYGETSNVALFAENKLSRSLLITGTARNSKLTEWKNHELSNRTYRNQNYAPYLRSTISRMLHAIQSTVERFTIYCHTDGFIVPFYRLQNCIRILDDAGIQFSIKGEGATEIHGTGAYRIGYKKTRNFGNRATGTRHITNFIRDDSSKWWMDTFVRGIELRRRYHRDSRE